MSRHRFKVGDFVTVNALRKTGSVMELLHGSSYRILIASLSIVCKEGELSEAQVLRQRPSASISLPRHTGPKPSQSLDLHGMTVDQATRRLEEWLSQAIVAGLSQGTIIHGHGTGRLQEATHRTLQTFSVVRAFRLNEMNPGETIVYF